MVMRFIANAATQPAFTPEQQAEMRRAFALHLALPIMLGVLVLLVVGLWLASRSRKKRLERGELPAWEPPEN